MLPKPAGASQDLSVLPTVSWCCQRSEAGQSSLRDAGCFLDAHLSEPASHPYLVLSVAWAPPQAFLQPPCHPQTRLCLDFRCWVLVGFIFLLDAESSTFPCGQPAFSLPSLSALLKLALLWPGCSGSPVPLWLLTLFCPGGV